MEEQVVLKNLNSSNLSIKFQVGVMLVLVEVTLMGVMQIQEVLVRKEINLQADSKPQQALGKMDFKLNSFSKLNLNNNLQL